MGHSNTKKLLVVDLKFGFNCVSYFLLLNLATPNLPDTRDETSYQEFTF